MTATVLAGRTKNTSVLGDVDAARAATTGFGNGNREESIFQLGAHAVHVNLFGQDEGTRETPMTALDAVELLARGLFTRAFAANDDAAFFSVDFDVFAGEARHFDGEHEAATCFEEIHRRIPARRVAPYQLTDVVVERQQVTEWIPPGEGHRGILACSFRLDDTC